MSMTSDAKSRLSDTIRKLRERLLTDLHAASESAYRLGLKREDADLNAAANARRHRLEEWIAEQVRAETGKKPRNANEFRLLVEKQAAYTLLNRLVLLRLLEASRLRQPAIVTGGWNSQGYKDFREIAPALVRGEETEGYAFLLQLAFEDLAIDLPGLFGSAGMADLIPIPAATLRAIVEALDDVELASCWTDDMTLGWVYQYWNDPERESLDKKISEGGKIEPHEIASKTQMFTERYIVDWLLQNSLGPMWLAMCRKHGWTPDVEADGTLDRLEQRRVEWRAKRDAGEVSLTELMPLHTDAERRWAYYVPQPIPQDAIDHAPESVRELKILDPAVGSGHFLVVAFDLLFALYQEEGRHRGESDAELWSDRVIVEQVLGYNLHGIDLDSRAVQIAAAALWMKGQLTCRDARPEQLNLVASNLRLASLPDNDPALVELRRTVEEETGIPGTLTDEIVHALRGADHLGSLLKIDAAVEEAITRHETQIRRGGDAKQMRLFDDGTPQQQALAFPKEDLKASVLDRLEEFLSRHTSGDDLGLRLRGEQLSAGVRFLRLVREETYDLVVGNPPYQGTSKMVDSKYVAKHYSLGKADLYAAFLLRGLELVRSSGVSSLLTMRNWMFIKQYSDLRQHLLMRFDLRCLGDFAIGAFDEVPNDVLSVVVSVAHKTAPLGDHSVACQPTSPDDRSYDRARTNRKRAATLCQNGRYEFQIQTIAALPERPVVYWWPEHFARRVAVAPKLGDICEVRTGMSTSNNDRFVRFLWEVNDSPHRTPAEPPPELAALMWAPKVMGAKGLKWVDQSKYVVRWAANGVEMKVLQEDSYGSSSRRIQSQDKYFRVGIAFSCVGNDFTARLHRFRSVFGQSGSSLFPDDLPRYVAILNREESRKILESLNPTISFQVGDVERVPDLPVNSSNKIVERIVSLFGEHESHREPSIEFKQPGASPWRRAQEWAQLAVDRPEGTPLPDYEPQFDPAPLTDHLSFALGVALGRFGANGEGILNAAKDDLSQMLPAGILYLDGTLDANDCHDGLGHPAAVRVVETWDIYSAAIAPRSSLRDYLREKFFEAVHRKMYENRPIHWPLSSAKKTFVAWVTIHRWNDSTLRVLLADHLQPTLTRLEGELTDLRKARDGGDKQAAKAAEKRFGDVLKSRDELAEFIQLVQQCAEKGPPPTDASCPPREADARYVPDLDDGVMINSAALWPLLAPQWKDPKKWWKELASSKGKKDYDWSHLAMRYWPTRVNAKCQQDPSLGVAHGCFWKYHPARAWAWELRLQDEIGGDFRITEASYRGDGGDGEHRDRYLSEHPAGALEAIAKEALRRRRKQKRPQPELRILESGLWSRLPTECWELELGIIKKQGVDF